VQQPGPAAAPPVIDGRYRIVRLLGQGAFARTLACEDTAEGNRMVALKELRVQGLEDWKPVELFEREARILASLRHAGVPEIYRSFEAADAGGKVALYLVMELIDGPSLQTRLASGPAFDEVELVDITLELLEVLDYLHGRAPPVYHRDIKPANVVLRRSGTPVLVDFGGVRDGWRPGAGGSTVTGTFGYMPPEQLLGQVSPASDLYALGATLLHLVTGREPSEFSLDSGRLEVPPEVTVRPALRRTIDALLAPAPRDRPRSARAARRLLLEETTDAGAGTPLLPPPAAAKGPPLMAIPRGGRPALVEVGPPPRDPQGALADVYLNLIDCFDGRHPHRGGAMKKVGLVAAEMMFGLITLGLVHLHVRRVNARRERQYGPLFREGLAAAGRVVNLRGEPSKSMSSALTYDYAVAGDHYRATMQVSNHLLDHLAVGDPLTVLHDPADPTRSCVVYRWVR
jgi:hypothetical protein